MQLLVKKTIAATVRTRESHPGGGSAASKVGKQRHNEQKKKKRQEKFTKKKPTGEQPFNKGGLVDLKKLEGGRRGQGKKSSNGGQEKKRKGDRDWGGVLTKI